MKKGERREEERRREERRKWDRQTGSTQPSRLLLAGGITTGSPL